MTFSFPFILSLIPAGISLVMLAIGTTLWRKSLRGAAVPILGLGMLFGVVFGPMLFMDRVTVDESRIQQTTGFWFAPTKKGFAFDGIERVHITKGRDLKGRPIEVWVAEYNSGDSVTIDPGDLWESNAEAIIAYIRKLGVDVEYDA